MNKIVLDTLEYIDNNIYTQISLDDLSNRLYFNKDYIMRVFKKELNLTIIDYINRKKIYNSLKGLRETDDLILKIALKYGFSSQEYYSETFTKIMGVNPHTYRKFTKNDISLSYEEIEAARTNLTNLQIQMKNIDSYRNNVETETVKKLSIF